MTTICVSLIFNRICVLFSSLFNLIRDISDAHFRRRVIRVTCVCVFTCSVHVHVVILTRECATRPAIYLVCVLTTRVHTRNISAGISLLWGLVACLYFCPEVRVFKLDIYYRLFIDTTVCTSQHGNSQLRVFFDGCCTCQFMAHLAVASWAVVWVQKALKLKCINSWGSS